MERRVAAWATHPNTPEPGSGGGPGPRVPTGLCPRFPPGRRQGMRRAGRPNPGNWHGQARRRAARSGQCRRSAAGETCPRRPGRFPPHRSVTSLQPAPAPCQRPRRNARAAPPAKRTVPAAPEGTAGPELPQGPGHAAGVAHAAGPLHHPPDHSCRTSPHRPIAPNSNQERLTRSPDDRTTMGAGRSQPSPTASRGWSRSAAGQRPRRWTHRVPRWTRRRCIHPRQGAPPFWP